MIDECNTYKNHMCKMWNCNNWTTTLCVEETDNDESLVFSGRGLDMKNVCNVPNGDEFAVVFTK